MEDCGFNCRRGLQRVLGSEDEESASSNNGSSVKEVAIGVTIVVIFVVGFYLKLFWQRRRIRTWLLTRERRAYAASLQYIGDQVVDAETLKDIRTRVVQIIFPPGNIVQSDDRGKPSIGVPIFYPSDPDASEQPATKDEIATGDEYHEEEGDEKPIESSDIIEKDSSSENATASHHEVPHEHTDAARSGNAVAAQQLAYYDPESNTVEQDGVFLDDSTRSDGLLVDDSTRSDGLLVDDSTRSDGVFLDDSTKSDGVFLDDSARSDYVRECSICLGEYNVGDETATISRCSHVFHRECILEWSTLKKQCPICRTDMWEPEQFERLQKDIAQQVIPAENPGIMR